MHDWNFWILLLTLWSSVPFFLLHIIEEEEKFTPDELSDQLLRQVVLARKAKVPANYRYQVPYQHILKEVERGHITEPMSEERLNDLRDSRFTKRWFRH